MSLHCVSVGELKQRERERERETLGITTCFCCRVYSPSVGSEPVQIVLEVSVWHQLHNYQQLLTE